MQVSQAKFHLLLIKLGVLARKLKASLTVMINHYIIYMEYENHCKQLFDRIF